MAQLAEFATNHPILVAGLFAAIIALIVYELRLKSQEVAQVSGISYHQESVNDRGRG